MQVLTKLPMTKMVKCWYDPGDMVTATDWMVTASPRCTCHHLWSVERGVKLQLSGSESTARPGS
jgi:hypothetical protein